LKKEDVIELKVKAGGESIVKELKDKAISTIFGFETLKIFF